MATIKEKTVVIPDHIQRKIYDSLIENGEVVLWGLGKITIKHVNKGERYNMQTGKKKQNNYIAPFFSLSRRAKRILDATIIGKKSI